MGSTQGKDMYANQSQDHMKPSIKSNENLLLGGVNESKQEIYSIQNKRKRVEVEVASFDFRRGSFVNDFDPRVRLQYL